MVDSLDAATDDGARALRRLQTELIGWLTTINPNGQPQASPIWFVWDGAELLLYSMTRTPRNGNIEERPLVAFNLGVELGQLAVAVPLLLLLWKLRASSEKFSRYGVRVVSSIVVGFGIVWLVQRLVG